MLRIAARHFDDLGPHLDHLAARLLPTAAALFANGEPYLLLKGGFWAMAHEARTDYAMLLGCIFLLVVGSGRLSLDARMATRLFGSTSVRGGPDARDVDGDR
jgi:hypothetical protein